MSKDIVIVGSCMIDFVSYVPRLPRPGETLIGSEFKRTFGGKGANQCVAATKLGASTFLVASLGNDIFGQEYLQLLKSLNVNIDHLKIRDNVNSGVAQIMVAENGENSIVIVVGANVLLSPTDVDEAHEVIKNATVLLAQFETCLETTLYALKLHKGHGTSIVNGAPAIKDVTSDILKNCDIFCLNETETEIMTGIQSLTLLNAQEAFYKLFNMGCNTVIITLGANGAIFASRNKPKMIHIPIDEVKPVDTTGAGDAFLGALAYFIAYHPQISMAESIRRACRIASQSVLKSGTQSSFPIKTELPDELFS
ncbi:ribokinase-like [Chelonus insularis]|uniref:ribokinase-like n=1 Tax=Chelonus insularis TaxID=460826 RepID=UPI00158DB27B|nr:ribokinase-like [Chelonus insularis]